MHDEGSFDSFSLKAFQNKSQLGCFCAVYMPFKTKFVLSICLAVACSFMESLKDMAVNEFKKTSIFSG